MKYLQLSRRGTGSTGECGLPKNRENNGNIMNNDVFLCIADRGSIRILTYSQMLSSAIYLLSSPNHWKKIFLYPSTIIKDKLFFFFLTRSGKNEKFQELGSGKSELLSSCL